MLVVSITVGGIVGTGIAAFGPHGVSWGFNGVGKIIVSWFLSPILAGICAAILFYVSQSCCTALILLIRCLTIAVPGVDHQEDGA